MKMAEVQPAGSCPTQRTINRRILDWLWGSEDKLRYLIKTPLYEIVKELRVSSEYQISIQFGGKRFFYQKFTIKQINIVPLFVLVR